MFRKTIALTLAAVMAVAIPFTSLADTQPGTTDTTTAIQEDMVQNGAIDFGKRMNREPSAVNQNAEGSTTMVYTGVTTEDYEAFSIILSEEGYELTGYEMLESGEGYRMFLHNAGNGVDITLAYIGTGSSAGTLSMTYPAGVAVEQETITEAGQSEPALPTAVPTPKPNDDICSYCNGDGFCTKCSGLGDCEHCFGRGTVDCNYCNGRGSCHLCYGSGGYMLSSGKWKTCSGCSGLGHCRHCYGTGDKTCGYCNGLGTCSRCYGLGTCSYCHGTGHK